jgi:YbbR domain-containing protein
MEGEGQVRDIFKSDITIKIGAVLIAILFWVYVYNNSNPFTSRTFSNIPLKIENEAFLADNGYIIKNKYKSSIDITIRGRQDAVNNVQSGDFEAILDFSKIKSLDDKTLAIDGPYCNQKDVVIESPQSPTIDIQLARKVSNSFTVQLVNNITMKPGYKILKTTVNPDKITINDEEDLIKSIASIKAVLDTNNLDRSLSEQVVCRVYNGDGKEINGISRSLNVDVSVEVAKEVPVTLVTKGKPSADFIETMRQVTPQTVLITGPADQLAKITDIKTEPLDIENLSRNLNAAPVIKLPAGIKFASTPQDIAVSITVEKLAVKDFNVSGSDIQIANPIADGTLKYEILTGNVPLQLKGRISDLDAINVASLLPSVDVGTLTEGTHKQPLSIVLPDQVKLLQDAFVEVKVTKAENPPG